MCASSQLSLLLCRPLAQLAGLFTCWRMQGYVMKHPGVLLSLFS